jgi:hypothetical protein
MRHAKIVRITLKSREQEMHSQREILFTCTFHCRCYCNVILFYRFRFNEQEVAYPHSIETLVFRFYDVVVYCVLA